MKITKAADFPLPREQSFKDRTDNTHIVPFAVKFTLVCMLMRALIFGKRSQIVKV